MLVVILNYVFTPGVDFTPKFYNAVISQRERRELFMLSACVTLHLNLKMASLSHKVKLYETNH